MGFLIIFNFLFIFKFLFFAWNWRAKAPSASQLHRLWRGCVYGAKKVQEMTNSFDLGYPNF